MAPTEIAAFDVDGTLTRRDCVIPFLSEVAGRARVAGALARHVGLLVAAARDRDRRDDVKAALTASLLTGRAAADVEAEGREFAAGVVRSGLRPDVAERLSWHRDEGHEVVLVTASFDAYIRPLAGLLGATTVLATELEADADGRLTGRLATPNCRGQEKVRRLVARFGEPPRLGWAYGDSPDDRPMLSLAQHPVLVGRDQIAAAPS